jgi:hypothetical protein
MDLLPFFKWMEGTTLSRVVGQSEYLSAFLGVAHLLSLVIFAGSVLVVDVRLLGGGMSRTPVSRIARDAQPWLIGSFLMLLITGIPQVVSLAMKQYYSPFFWWKMLGIVVGLVFTFTIRRSLTQAEEGRVSPIVLKAAGVFSIVLWTGVTVGARLIGLLS